MTSNVNVGSETATERLNQDIAPRPIAAPHSDKIPIELTSHHQVADKPLENQRRPSIA
jgi:hypothetical protein